MPATSARAARPTSSWSTATRSAIPPRSGGCGDGSGATAEGSSLVRPVLLFADLLVAEAAPAHDAVAVGDHAGVAAEVDGAVAGAQAGLVRVLAQHVLDTAGLAGPLRVVPRTAHRGRVGEPAALGVEGSQLLVVAQLLGPAGALDGHHRLVRRPLAAQLAAAEAAQQADERRDPGHRRHEQVGLVDHRRVPEEQSLAAAPH